MNTRLRRDPRQVPLASMSPQAVLQKTSHYSTIWEKLTCWNKCHLRRPMANGRLFQDMVSLSPLFLPDVSWVLRPFPSGYLSKEIAAQFKEHRGTLLWTFFLTLNANCEEILLEIWSLNLMHTLKIGRCLWYLSSGQLHFNFWPDFAQDPEVKIRVIGKSFMATSDLRNLEKAAKLTWNRVRGWHQNALSTRCCTEIDFTSKKEFGFVKKQQARQL